MPSAPPPPPESTPPRASLLARAGSLVGAGCLAALLGSVPATVRLAHEADGPFRAWVVLGACALGPLVVALAFARSAREGARSVAGGEAPLVPWAITTWAMTTFLALTAFGAVLRTTTHHHGLAGVTFALGGLFLGGAIALVVRRLMHIARAADPLGRAALVVCILAVLACALLVVVVRVARAGGAEVPSTAIVDLLAFVIAAGALSRQTFAHVAWLAYYGPPVAVGLLWMGWALLGREPSLLDAIHANAPLFAPMAGILAAVGR